MPAAASCCAARWSTCAGSISMPRSAWCSRRAPPENRRGSAGELAACCAISRVRVLLRQQRLDDACQALQAIPLAPPGDATASALRQLALGEYHIEANEVAQPRAALAQALRAPAAGSRRRAHPGEPVACLSSSSAWSTCRVPCGTCEQARAMLRGAAVWREVIQMDVALASLLRRAVSTTARRRCSPRPRSCAGPSAARTRHPDRSRHGALERRAAAGRRRGRRLPAGGESLCRTGEPARTGEHGVVHGRHPDRGQAFPEAYRTLATGLAIARHRRWPAAEAVFRAHIDRLRNEVLVGPQRFDEMVARMVSEMKER
jgi:hypothetical protein